MRDRAKSRIREAVAIGAAVGAAALGVGAAVAATSPSLVSAPQSANAPSALGELSPPPAQVKGYTILRPSSLVMDTPAGLRILYGTGLAVTGLLDIDAIIEEARDRSERSPAAPAQRNAAPSSPVAAPAPPAGAPVTAAAEPDFPGQGEEHRSDTADPKRSDRAEAQAGELSDVPRQSDRSSARDR